MEPASVDMILCDLPYGTTQNKWDSVIPLDELWEQFRRVIKPTGAIVLTAAQPFTSLLVSSNWEMFKYEWIWEKTKKTGFLNAKRQPLRNHESILVFYDQQPVYNPQGIIPCLKRCDRGSEDGTGENYGKANPRYLQTQTGYPCSVLKIRSEGKPQHPTQKPLSLFEYLIKTYSNPGDLVLDPCMGSGTTALAARKTGRNYIGFELSPEYCEIAERRLAEELTLHGEE